MTPSRRHWLASAAALATLPTWTAPARAHARFGPVQPPMPAPALPLHNTDGQQAGFDALLRGRTTAVQLMFTGCSATCPIQGALFAQAQQRLASEDSRLRLLSVSIDPLGDDVAALQGWLAKFGAQATRWNAALPRMRDVDRLLDFLRGRAPGADRHTAQAFVFDRRAQLAYRTEEMPDPVELVRLMHGVAARS